MVYCWRVVAVCLVASTQSVAAKGWGLKRDDLAHKPTPVAKLETAEKGIVCENGKYKQRGRTHPKQDCEMCPPGKYSIYKDNHFCDLCTSNEVQPQKGKDACTACPKGKLADKTKTGCKKYKALWRPKSIKELNQHKKRQADSTAKLLKLLHDDEEADKEGNRPIERSILGIPLDTLFLLLGDA
jgi:hypothetical protein